MAHDRVHPVRGRRRHRAADVQSAGPAQQLQRPRCTPKCAMRWPRLQPAGRARAGAHRGRPRLLRRPGPERPRRRARAATARRISASRSRRTTSRWCWALRALPLPVIAAVNGVAAGAGANIALACDLVIAARRRASCRPSAKLGLVPDSGGTWFLPRLVGNARAHGPRVARRQAAGDTGGRLGPDLALRRGRANSPRPWTPWRRSSPPRRRAASRAPSRPSTAPGSARSAGQLDVERDLQRELGRSRGLRRRRGGLHREARAALHRALSGSQRSMTDGNRGPAGQLAERSAQALYAPRPRLAGARHAHRRGGARPARVTMSVRADMTNGHAICHGGLIFALADSAFAFACNSDSEATVAAAASIDFLAPARAGDALSACARRTVARRAQRHLRDRRHEPGRRAHRAVSRPLAPRRRQDVTRSDGMQLESYVWARGARRGRGHGAARRQHRRGHRARDRGGLRPRGNARARAPGRRPGAARLPSTSAPRCCKALAQDVVRAQGRVLRALLRDRRHEGRLLDRHRRRHRHHAVVTRARAGASCPTAASTSTARSRHCRRAAPSSASTSACRSRARRSTSTPSTSRSGACWRSSRRRCSPGVPAIVKPATATAYLTERVVRRIVESGDPAARARCSSSAAASGDLFDHLNCQDVVSFTGSASTAREAARASRPCCATPCASSPRPIRSTPRSSAPDAAPGTPEFDLFIKEVVREMTVKAGQKCTAIRKALVPAAIAGEVDRRAAGARSAGSWSAIRALEGVRMGPLASLAQRTRGAGARRGAAARGASSSRRSENFELVGADRERGAFVPPLLLLCRRCRQRRARCTTVEAFGPVATVLPYGDIDDAIALARRGEGSLAGSVFTADDAARARARARAGAVSTAASLVVNRHCAKESTGHGSPLPHLVHGGPGRAGGGEEMGGIRGVLHYMQRTARPGLARHAHRDQRPLGARRAPQRDPGRHPFRKPFDELAARRHVQVGRARGHGRGHRALRGAFSGDNFYAHMNETEAARNPLFGGRVAHGYFLDLGRGRAVRRSRYGPVLGNYGLDNLRFVKPVKPGDRIKVRLTCKEKIAARGQGLGRGRLGHGDHQPGRRDGRLLRRADHGQRPRRAGPATGGVACGERIAASTSRATARVLPSLRFAAPAAACSRSSSPIRAA